MRSSSIINIVAGLGLALACTSLATAPARAPAPPEQRQLERDVFKELIEHNTTHAVGSTAAAQAMAARLRSAGFTGDDVQVLTPKPDKGNLVARLRGKGRAQPILFMAHLDVVDAPKEDWATDPFKLTERDGYFYGRGTVDNKDGCAALVLGFMRLKREGFVPNRDLIIALTGDEESGGDLNGMQWLVENRRELIEPAFVINVDAGGGQIIGGKPTWMGVQTSEKIFTTYHFTTRNPGGHSSLPTAENAVYRLAAALGRLERHRFPVGLNETTRQYFERSATRASGQEAADLLALAKNNDEAAATRLSAKPYYNALMRNTCVPTIVNAGHAENALPTLARAVIQCRVLPQEDPRALQKVLTEIVADPQVEITLSGNPQLTPASVLSPEVIEPVRKLTQEMWPGAEILPLMSTGATDGIYTRRAGMQTYGVSGTYIEFGDNRMHATDERIRVDSFHDSMEFGYRLMRTLAGGR